MRFENRTGKTLEQITRQGRQRFLPHPTEIALYTEAFRALRRVPGNEGIDPLLEVVELENEQLAVAQDIERRDAWQHPVPARFREQGAIVAARQVAIAAAQIDDPQRLLDRLIGLRNIIGTGNDMFAQMLAEPPGTHSVATANFAAIPAIRSRG